MNRLIHPRVGSEYSKSGLRGHKIMILGESSYHPNSAYDLPNQTINVGNDAIGYDQGRGYWNKSRFYTRISRIFGYEAQSYERRQEFWNSVIYYNFLQVVLTKSREHPPTESWTDAKPAFLETIDEYRPEFVVSFSKRMWGYLPKENSCVVSNTLGVQCWSAELDVGGFSTKLYGFLHPTAPRFYWQPVGELLRDLIPNKEREQGGTGQPATRSQSKSEGSDMPQPKSEGRSR